MLRPLLLRGLLRPLPLRISSRTGQAAALGNLLSATSPVGVLAASSALLTPTCSCSCDGPGQTTLSVSGSAGVAAVRRWITSSASSASRRRKAAAKMPLRRQRTDEVLTATSAPIVAAASNAVTAASASAATAVSFSLAAASTPAAPAASLTESERIAAVMHDLLKSLAHHGVTSSSLDLAVLLRSLPERVSLPASLGPGNDERTTGLDPSPGGAEGLRDMSPETLERVLRHRLSDASLRQAFDPSEPEHLSLAWEGDATWFCGVSVLLKQAWPKASRTDLSKMRDQLLRNDVQGELMRRVQLLPLIHSVLDPRGAHLAQLQRARRSPKVPKLLADSLEALLGVVARDVGLDASLRLVHAILGDDILSDPLYYTQPIVRAADQREFMRKHKNKLRSALTSKHRSRGILLHAESHEHTSRSSSTTTSTSVSAEEDAAFLAEAVAAFTQHASSKWRPHVRTRLSHTSPDGIQWNRIKRASLTGTLASSAAGASTAARPIPSSSSSTWRDARQRKVVPLRRPPVRVVRVRRHGRVGETQAQRNARRKISKLKRRTLFISCSLLRVQPELRPKETRKQRRVRRRITELQHRISMQPTATDGQQTDEERFLQRRLRDRLQEQKWLDLASPADLPEGRFKRIRSADAAAGRKRGPGSKGVRGGSRSTKTKAQGYSRSARRSKAQIKKHRNTIKHTRRRR